jgi:hypothetical protein
LSFRIGETMLREAGRINKTAPETVISADFH